LKSNIEFLYCIVGLGSIGKYHAETYSKLPGKFLFIDPDENASEWAKKFIKQDYKFYKNIMDSQTYISSIDLPKIGIISNWGNQHYSSLIDLKNLGFKKFLIEKPIASSLQQIDHLLKMVKNEKIQFVAGFGWRHSGLPEKIKEISSLYLGGNPQLISMTGGAFGTVTNGIHFLDLAISIFDSNPQFVFSNLKSDKINPRSKNLDFWNGVSSWSFPNDKNLIISSSNKSSIASSIEIICAKGKIIIDNKMSVSVYKRDTSEIENDPRVTRLGPTFKQKDLGYIPDYSKANNRLINPLINGTEDISINEEREIMATKSMIYALISSSLGRKIDITEKIENKYYNKEWKIS